MTTFGKWRACSCGAGLPPDGEYDLCDYCRFGDLHLRYYLVRAHTDACRAYSADGGDPWNIYFRMGVVAAWLTSIGKSDEVKPRREWDKTDLRERFYAFANDVSSRGILAQFDTETHVG